MTQENMTQDEKINSDKLDFYFNEKIAVHLILTRKLPDGSNVWVNGTIKQKLSDRIWLLNEKILGEIRVAISEIMPYGVKEMKEMKI